MVTDVGTALKLLSGIATPTVLIIATSSIILATSNRQGRVIERVRKLHSSEALRIEPIIPLVARRAILLQQTLMLLYIALAIFCLTSAAIGFDIIFGPRLSTGYLLMALLGIAFLVGGCVLLVCESVLAVRAVKIEVQALTGEINKG